MSGMWLLVFLIIQAGNLIRVLNGSFHGSARSDEPTCEELRTFWNAVSQSMRMNEFTNEIPLIPFEVFSYIDNHYQKSQRPKPFGPANLFQNAGIRNSRPSAVQESFLEPQEHEMRPSQDLDAFFGKFHEPSRALGDWETSNSISGPSMAQSGTKKKGGSESMQFPSWGAPEEVGMFGRFVDFDENVPIITRDRGLKSNTGGWSEPLFSPPSYATGESCHRVINRRCTVDEQCLCANQNMLRCRLGKCSNYHSYTGEENKYGFWHDGPLPSSQLGLHKRLQKRRSDKSIFM